METSSHRAGVVSWLPWRFTRWYPGRLDRAPSASLDWEAWRDRWDQEAPPAVWESQEGHVGELHFAQVVKICHFSLICLWIYVPGCVNHAYTVCKVWKWFHICRDNDQYLSRMKAASSEPTERLTKHWTREHWGGLKAEAECNKTWGSAKKKRFSVCSPFSCSSNNYQT